MQGALEKEYKLKAKLQVKQDENNEILAKLLITKQNINMEKHNKDIEKIKIERDFLQATLIQTDANYWKLKSKKIL